MTHITVGIDIAAPPGAVWCVIEQVEDHVRWMHDAVAIRFATDQTRGVGTRAIVVTKVGPFRLDDEMTITEWTEASAMGVVHTGVVTGAGRFSLQPNERGGTRFEWDEDLRFPWWLGGPIGAAGAKPLMAAIWRRNLRELKQLVEDHTAVTR